MSVQPVKKLISRCPFCEGKLEISRLGCVQCDTSIETTLPIPAFFRLPPDMQEFVMIFLRCQGKIRDVEKELGVSYPTVIKRLDLVNVLLGNQAAPSGRKDILEQLERGEITVQEATQLLKST
ncbi:MAG: DUF2089 domain-containing protein [Luteolibacter sp.]|uniref:DUF2089 domain-containing protein n=1 Tax=Luteolibacter sp. TaxID=1962973 RepID=UPI00326462E8